MGRHQPGVTPESRPTTQRWLRTRLDGIKLSPYMICKSPESPTACDIRREASSSGRRLGVQRRPHNWRRRPTTSTSTTPVSMIQFATPFECLSVSKGGAAVLPLRPLYCLRRGHLGRRPECQRKTPPSSPTDDHHLDDRWHCHWGQNQ